MSKKELEIRLLDPIEAIRSRSGMYVSDISGNASVIFREVIDNATDEINAGYGDKIFISADLNGWSFCGDVGRGIPIAMSKDRPGLTQAYVAISELHSGSKFEGHEDISVGQNGVGIVATNALSEEFILASKITEANYNKSIPEVKNLWDSCIRSKKDIFYVVVTQRGKKVYEGAMKLKEIEKKTKTTLPEGCSTIVLFKPDPLIWGTPKCEVPNQNLQNFLIIQEKFFKRPKIDVIVDGKSIKNTFKPYQFEICKTIVPADPTYNKGVGVYITFEANNITDKPIETGSVNGLVVNNGIHINLARNLFKAALKDQYKIKHEYLTEGLKFNIIVLCQEVLFDSQVKSNLKSIKKVTQKDFVDIVKEFEKIFRKCPDYWDNYVDQLNQLADSMKKIGASDKAQRMIDSSSGRDMYRNKSTLSEGFADATCGASERMKAELFLCFSGDTEILTCNDEKIRFDELVPRVESGEKIYTFSVTNKGILKPAKIIAAKKIKKTSTIATVVLDNGESFRCTPDHKIMKLDGTYIEAKDLKEGDSLMPCYISTGSRGRRRVRSYNAIKHKTGEKTSIDVFHLMSKHIDASVTESVKKETDPRKIAVHHLNGDKLNDSPTNLITCTNSEHITYHAKDNCKKLHEKAKNDPDLYNRVYIDSKNTESYKQKKSATMKELYSSERGASLKVHLKDKANQEWKDEELRKWRAEETAKYFKEHPEWAKKNIEIKGKNVAEKTLNKITSVLGHAPKTSVEYDMTVAKLISNDLKGLTKSPGKGKGLHIWKFSTIKALIPEKTKDIIDMEKDYGYAKSKYILECLVSEGLPITLSNYNSKALSLFYPWNSNLEQGIGYKSSKNKYPELFKEYEASNNVNHKVVSVTIENLPEEIDVYCLEVDTEEHNFPLASGVFVKNCEGLSPAGSLKAGRKDTRYAAVCALRGKTLNTSQVSAERMLDNKELNTIFTVIGLGLDVNNVTKGCTTREEAWAKIQQYSRYGKICIATDSDPDGDNIKNLLLYTFSKFARFLIDFGMVYIAEGPEFIQDGKYYYPSDPKVPGSILPVGLNPNKRFRHIKGLGSLNREDIYDAFYNPATRRLIQVTPEGIARAMELSENIDKRKELLRDNKILTNPYGFTDI